MVLGMNIFTFALAVLAFATSVSAQETECYQQEIDPQTKQIYQNRAQWEADRSSLWDDRAPVIYSPFRLQRGYSVARAESRNAQKMGYDKGKHCYVGCRVANDVDYEVAVYAGYYKEDKDLLDCKPSTHFDLTDLAATIAGADFALSNPGRADADFCKQQCRQAFRR